MLHHELIQDTCSAERAASFYAVSRRTLCRHLTAEGSSFRQLTTEVRCELACLLLAASNLSLGQIAEILNYAELSAFSRAFRRWTGQSPSAWRSSERGLAG
ncbi:helix-turn-helix domain-containing protein [Microvirga lotononidis]|uniref:DNA-binding domain-containing protein, AraC-type n=1 Tax=Microvirga lotononidis TaxID=864069 RepID=I4Z3J0_9HYPH|nr:AraC family transcriptional regulator [Microvirga lotononidis]EIM30782.1 DNA-binding domain-containing protein, AraC-type [Microvirga lotononidis]WQO31733.1 AraC family transcriptional regulator [Microvirga lotononidis]